MYAWKQTIAGLGAIGFLTMPAAADVAATAATDLNIRAGPGPEFQVVGVVAASDAVAVGGCVEGGQWCSVNNRGTQGWAYSAYLVTAGEAPQVLSTGDVAVPTVTYDGPEAAIPGAIGGAIVGAVIAGPVGAAIGGAAGAAAGIVVDPPREVITYVTGHPVNPVFLDGEVVVGATLPSTMAATPIPDYQYGYAYVNGVPVLVEPGSRQVVYVVR